MGHSHALRHEWSIRRTTNDHHRRQAHQGRVVSLFFSIQLKSILLCRLQMNLPVSFFIRAFILTAPGYNVARAPTEFYVVGSNSSTAWTSLIYMNMSTENRFKPSSIYSLSYQLPITTDAYNMIRVVFASSSLGVGMQVAINQMSFTGLDGTDSLLSFHIDLISYRQHLGRFLQGKA